MKIINNILDLIPLIGIFTSSPEKSIKSWYISYQVIVIIILVTYIVLQTGPVTN